MSHDYHQEMPFRLSEHRGSLLCMTLRRKLYITSSIFFSGNLGLISTFPPSWPRFGASKLMAQLARSAEIHSARAHSLLCGWSLSTGNHHLGCSTDSHRLEKVFFPKHPPKSQRRSLFVITIKPTRIGLLFQWISPLTTLLSPVRVPWPFRSQPFPRLWRTARAF